MKILYLHQTQECTFAFAKLHTIIRRKYCFCLKHKMKNCYQIYYHDYEESKSVTGQRYERANFNNHM